MSRELLKDYLSRCVEHINKTGFSKHSVGGFYEYRAEFDGVPITIFEKDPYPDPKRTASVRAYVIQNDDFTGLEVVILGVKWPECMGSVVHEMVHIYQIKHTNMDIYKYQSLKNYGDVSTIVRHVVEYSAYVAQAAYTGDFSMIYRLTRREYRVALKDACRYRRHLTKLRMF